MAQYTLDRLRSDYLALWDGMVVVKVSEANAQARRIVEPKAKAIYKRVEKATGVPWFVVGCLHMRESDADFKTWLHNGDPMKDKSGHPVQTGNVPARRPPDPDCTWEQGAYDALVVVEHLNEIENWGPEHVAYAAEKFNGFGYRRPDRNIPSPYLWGGTNRQKPGKFVRDGKYDAHVMDPQVGAMAVLKQIMELDHSATFDAPEVPAYSPVSAPPPPTPISPRADDTEREVKPLTKSKTIWGVIGGYLTTGVSAFVAFFDKLATPYGLAVLVVVLTVGGIFAWLAIKGRIDVQGIIKHLSEDDTGEAS